jgi:Protein of unknown function (DUF4238)
MARARQHHFVQARYLDGFLAPGSTRLVCYGRGRSKFHRSIPDGVATQRDFYAIPSGPPGANIETFLESKIETPGLEALRRLVENRVPPSVEDRISLGRYVAFQEMRVPYSRELNREHMRRLFEDKALQLEKSGKSSLIFQNVATAEGIQVRHSEPYEVSRDEVEEYLANMNSNPDTFDLEQMINLANDMTKFYVSMNWTVLFARPSTAFVTSDCPVFRQFDRPGGDNALLRPDCSVCCPLSSRAFLIMRSDIEYLKVAAREGIEGNGHTLPPTEFRTVSNQGVANFNRRVTAYAQRWCFSGTEEDWIIGAMQGPSLRRKPALVSKNGGTWVQWRRDGEP